MNPTDKYENYLLQERIEDARTRYRKADARTGGVVGAIGTTLLGGTLAAGPVAGIIGWRKGAEGFKGKEAIAFLTGSALVGAGLLLGARHLKVSAAREQRDDAAEDISHLEKQQRRREAMNDILSGYTL